MASQVLRPQGKWNTNASVFQQSQLFPDFFFAVPQNRVFADTFSPSQLAIRDSALKVSDCISIAVKRYITATEFISIEVQRSGLGKP